MRLIADFLAEQSVYRFHLFLKGKGIENFYEPSKSREKKESGYQLWIIHEDDYDKTIELYTRYLAHPEAEEFQEIKKAPPSPPPTLSPTDKGWKIKVDLVRPPRIPPAGLTHFFILLCALLFFWNNVQEMRLIKQEGLEAVGLAITPLEQTLFFDDPPVFQLTADFFKEYPLNPPEELKNLPPDVQARYKKIEEMPTWKGFSDLLVKRTLSTWKELPNGTLFGKIRQGEVWRFFTPCLLHQGFLHILFNMAWFWLLGRQIEVRLGKLRLLALIILCAACSNIAQYLVGGPYFLGFSGVVVGLVGFIWMRQKKAPWEGYPLQRSTAFFILLFVLGLLGVEIISMGLQFFHITELSAHIANTAHIVGGLVGMGLGKLSLFERKV